MLFALLGSRSFHRDPLVCAPGPILSGGRLIHPPDTSMDILAAWGGIGPHRDLPFPGLIGEPVADLELHGKDASCPGRQGWRHTRELRLDGLGLCLLPGARFSHSLRHDLRVTQPWWGGVPT